MELKNLLAFDWPVVASLAAVVVAVAAVYYKIYYDYWKRRGFPEFPEWPVPFLGHTTSLLLGGGGFNDLFMSLYSRAGDKPFLGYFHGNAPSIMLRDPEIIKHVLVKDFHVFIDRAFGLDEDIDPLNAKGLFNLKGQRWKEMRARLSPTFTSGRMKAMFPLMLKCAEELNESIAKKIAKNGGEGTIESKEYMACYSTDVIATCAFGIHCDALQNPETSEFRKMGKLVFEPTLRRRILLGIFLMSPRLLKLTGMKFTDDVTSSFFRNFVQDMVAQREEAIEQNEKGGGNTKAFGDFIHHLVMLKKKGLHKDDLEDEEDQREGVELEHNKLKEEPSWASIDNEDLTAQVMIFFSAGFETTSSLMSFALFELASSEKGQAIQEKLREEIDRVMSEEEGGPKFTYAGIQKMHLLDRIIKEALRLYPPAGVLSRKSIQPYIIPGTSLVLDAGTQLFIPTQAMQLDEKFFPNPTVFDPDRFLPENKESIQQFSYLPFGDGPRLCIGERFALMQAKLGLASLISKFKFEVCREKTDIPLRFKKKAFVLTSEQGIWLKVKHRDVK